MTPSKVGVAVVAAGLLLCAALATAPVLAQAPSQPPQPFAPQWAMLPGWDLFGTKGCGGCHAVRGVGGTVGPDLARIETAKSFFEIGADMWNHLPRMGERMREAGVQRARLTPVEAGNLVAFLFTAQYFDTQGDAKAGERLFTAKGCVKCHRLGGSGGLVGPALDRLKRVNSPVIVAAAMWNHGPQMARAMRDAGVSRPRFEGNELLDVIAYINAAAQDTGADSQQIVPGTPERGRQLFAEKKCSVCHAVGGVGGRVGLDLGTPGHHISLTQFAARMWNHAPGMTERMKERNIEVPTLSGQDLADIVAYLYVSRYFEASANVQRGQELVRTKGCTGCHAIAGKGGKVAGDFTRSTLVRTPSGLVAGMWNHASLMEAAAEKRQVRLPTLTGRELGDISAYLASLSAPRKGTAR
jgi:mono/diheme cytochrome c family protein